MGRATDIVVGGESPWEIARAFPYVQLTRRSSTQLEIRMSTPDDRGWPFARALEQLTTEQPEAGPDGRAHTLEVRKVAALMQLIDGVRRATGAEVPALSEFYGPERARSRHPSARRSSRRRDGHAA
jgi:hypothetical protein